ncbi:MAG: hypothetical protein Q8S12_00465 [Hydrogenophaga sp.]|uniref:hypothetical protein n=1 Tax=Hydrogenophaga sp. TaxID=1904254 RepID=UPI0027370FF8|nr:hypothetical protein [Hydrogenophaga sp.]MDP3625039.1 hypothetical protein [Hydrogenophaga sp.]
MTARTNWAMGLLACVALFAVHALVDDQANEAQNMADELAVAQQLAAVQAGIDALAQQICNTELGPGTRVLWTVDGDLVCRPATLTAEGGKP